MTRTLLFVDNLSVTYNRSSGYAVHDVSFSVNEGETVIIIGESGCGKSTIFKSIVNALPQTATINGSVLFDGVDVRATKRSSHEIGIVLQDSTGSLNPTLKIKRQMKHVLQGTTANIAQSAQRKLLHNSLAEVGFQNPERILNSFPSELSGGMCQRVNIAMSLMGTQKLLLLDEPTSSLDAYSQTEIIAMLQQIKMQRNLSLLFITHDIHLAMHIADKIIVMKNGSIVEIAEKINGDFVFRNDYSNNLVFKSSYISKHITNPLPNTIVEFKNVNKSFQTNLVISNLSFSINKREIFGIVGATGTGKSTICKMLCGMIKPSSGTINREGVKIEYVFQNVQSSFNPLRTIRESLLEFTSKSSLSETLIMIRTLLDTFNLTYEMIDKKPFELSGGQQQKFAIIRALISNPDLLIFDEPTSALDASSRAEFLNLIGKINTNYDISCVIISHDNLLIKSICTRYIDINQRPYSFYCC